MSVGAAPLHPPIDPAIVLVLLIKNVLVPPRRKIELPEVCPGLARFSGKVLVGIEPAEPGVNVPASALESAKISEPPVSVRTKIAAPTAAPPPPDPPLNE